MPSRSYAQETVFPRRHERLVEGVGRQAGRKLCDGPVHAASRTIVDRNGSYLGKLRRHGWTRNVHCTVPALIDYAGGRMAFVGHGSWAFLMSATPTGGLEGRK